VYLWISICIALLAAVLQPLAQRFQATSLWAGRALTPLEHRPQVGSLGLQSAINEGWPSYFGLLGGILPVLAIILGFLHAWWLGPLVLLGWLIVTSFLEATIIPKDVEWYLSTFIAHMVRREANYARNRDFLRAKAAHDLAEELQELFDGYAGSGIPAPTMAIAKRTPFGDWTSLASGQLGQRQRMMNDSATGPITNAVAARYFVFMQAAVATGSSDILDALAIGDSSIRERDPDGVLQTEALWAAMGLGVHLLPSDLPQDIRSGLLIEIIRFLEERFSEDTTNSFRAYCRAAEPSSEGGAPNVSALGARYLDEANALIGLMRDDLPRHSLVGGRILLCTLGIWDAVFEPAGAETV